MTTSSAGVDMILETNANQAPMVEPKQEPCSPPPPLTQPDLHQEPADQENPKQQPQDPQAPHSELPSPPPPPPPRSPLAETKTELKVEDEVAKADTDTKPEPKPQPNAELDSKPEQSSLVHSPPSIDDEDSRLVKIKRLKAKLINEEHRLVLMKKIRQSQTRPIQAQPLNAQGISNLSSSYNSPNGGNAAGQLKKLRQQQQLLSQQQQQLQQSSSFQKASPGLLLNNNNHTSMNLTTTNSNFKLNNTNHNQTPAHAHQRPKVNNLWNPPPQQPRHPPPVGIAPPHVGNLSRQPITTPPNVVQQMMTNLNGSSLLMKKIRQSQTPSGRSVLGSPQQQQPIAGNSNNSFNSNSLINNSATNNASVQLKKLRQQQQLLQQQQQQQSGQLQGFQKAAAGLLNNHNSLNLTGNNLIKNLNQTPAHANQRQKVNNLWNPPPQQQAQQQQSPNAANLAQFNLANLARQPLTTPPNVVQQMMNSLTGPQSLLSALYLLSGGGGPAAAAAAAAANAAATASASANQSNRQQSLLMNANNLAAANNIARNRQSQQYTPPSTSSPTINKSQAAQMLLQKRTAAKSAIQKQLEQTLMQLPQKHVQSGIDFVPNANNLEFVYYVGLEACVDYLTDTKNPLDIQPLEEPFECSTCGTDFTPSWSWKRSQAVCENCVSNHVKKSLKNSQANRIKSVLAKAAKQEQEMDQRIMAEAANVVSSSTSTLTTPATSSSGVSYPNNFCPMI